MSTWIELRCGNQANDSADGHGSQRCWSHDNTGPMMLCHDTRRSVLDALRELDEEARESGWKRTKEGWVCPFCVEALAKEAGRGVRDE